MDEMRYYNSSMTLEEAERYIQGGLITAARAYVANGYYLRRIRDDKLFEEAGYQNFEDYVREKYNKDKGWASKCIKVNQQLSEGGNSPILSNQYLEYSTYQLVELAYMTEEQREEAAPDMTVNQLKQIRKPEESAESEKSCDVTTSEPEEEIEPEEINDDSIPCDGCRHELGLDGRSDCETCSDYESFEQKQEPEEEKLSPIQRGCITGMSPYGSCVCCGYDGAECCGECEESCNGRCGWIEDVPYRDAQEAGLGMIDEYVEQMAEEKGEERQESNASNYLKVEDQKIDHFLNQNESIDDAYGATRAEMVNEYLKTGYKNPDKECEFMAFGLKYKAIKGEDVTVFYGVSGTASFDVENTRLEREYNYFFGDRNIAESESEEPETISESQETVIDGEFVELILPEQETIKAILEEEKKKLQDWVKAFEADEVEAWPPFIGRQKIIIAALEALAEEQEQPESESEPEFIKPEQPELPLLKNNDQRKDFIDSYASWPIWIDQKETGERYYRYDLSDKVAMVVKVSWKHSWGNYKESKDYEYGAEQYYLLGINYEWHNGKNTCKEDDTRTFYECSTNMTALVEYLKEFQKKK